MNKETYWGHADLGPENWSTKKINFLMLSEQTSAVDAYTSCTGLGELSNSLSFFSLRHCNEVSIVTPSLQMRKLRQKEERWVSQICSLIQLQACSSPFYYLLQRKESIVPSRSTHNPNLFTWFISNKLLQCHQLLLIFSESHGLKGWVKCFPKSTECTKKEKRK